MNIVEAYKKFKGQFIIFVSGLSGCGKTSIAKKISSSFGFSLIEQFDYYKKDYNTKITLPNGVEVINWSTDEAIDWDRLNSDIDKEKQNGIVVSGFALPKDKIKNEVDVHIHLSMSKKTCIERRKAYLEKHKDKYPEEYKNMDSDLEKLKMNQLVYPYHLQIVSRSNINKFFNLNKIEGTDILWDQVWDYLMSFIIKYIGWFNKNKFNEWIESNPNDPYVKSRRQSSNNKKDIKNDSDDKIEDDTIESDEFSDKIDDGPIEFIPIDPTDD
jgi:uridine kinase